MALFGIKKDNDKEKEQKSEKDNLLDMVPVDSESQDKKVPAKLKDDTGDAYRILIMPVTTEKSYLGAQTGKFVFKVSKKANKISVKKAIEKVYDVHVRKINVANFKGKSRNFGRVHGRTSDWKKAIVTLKRGETIGDAQI